MADRDIGFGPVSFWALLKSEDRAADRDLAAGRAEEIGKLVEGLSYEEAYVALLTDCLALLQNVSPEDQKNLAASGVSPRQMSMPENVTLRILAAYLMNSVGPDALKAAIVSLAGDLRPEAVVGRRVLGVVGAFAGGRCAWAL